MVSALATLSCRHTPPGPDSEPERLLLYGLTVLSSVDRQRTRSLRLSPIPPKKPRQQLSTASGFNNGRGGQPSPEASECLATRRVTPAWCNGFCVVEECN
eukprot:1553771-Rhodomonas_salina.2